MLCLHVGKGVFFVQKKNIVLLCLITFLQGMVFYAAVATLYRQAAGLTVFQITAIEGISVALAMALEVPWGYLADRIGYRRTLIICNLLFFVTKLIFWKAHSFAGFLTERILLAVVISGLSGVDSGMLYLSAPPEFSQRNRGWYQAAGEAGMLLSGLIYTLLLSGRYRAAALWTAVTYALAAVLTFFLAEVRPEAELCRKRRLLPLIRGHFRVPGMAALVLCGALFFEITHCVAVWFGQLQYIRCGMGDRAVGAAFVIVSASALCGPFSAPLTRRLGPLRTGRVLLVSAAVIMGILALTRSAVLSVLLIVLTAALTALFGPLAGKLENDLITVPDRATALSLNAMLRDSLIILIDLGLGRAADISLSLTLGLCCIGCILALLAFILYCHMQ